MSTVGDEIELGKRNKLKKAANDTQVNGVGLSSSPSVVVFQEKLYCFHQGKGNNGELRYSVFDGNKENYWEKDKRVEEVSILSSPSVMVFQEKLWCLYQQKDNNGKLGYSVFKLEGNELKEDANDTKVNNVSMSSSPSAVVSKSAVKFTSM